MRKIIKKTGNSAMVILDREDMKCHGMKIGEVIEIDITTAKELKAKDMLGGRAEAGQSSLEEQVSQLKSKIKNQKDNQKLLEELDELKSSIKSGETK